MVEGGGSIAAPVVATAAGAGAAAAAALAAAASDSGGTPTARRQVRTCSARRSNSLGVSSRSSAARSPDAARSLGSATSTLQGGAGVAAPSGPGLPDTPPAFETWRFDLDCGLTGAVRVSEFADLRPLSPRHDTGREAYARPANKRDLGHRCVFCRRPFNSLGMEIVAELHGGPSQRFHKMCWRRRHGGERPQPVPGPAPNLHPASSSRSSPVEQAPLEPRSPPAVPPKAMVFFGGRAAPSRQSDQHPNVAFGSSVAPPSGASGGCVTGVAVCGCSGPSASPESGEHQGNAVTAYADEWRRSADAGIRRGSMRRTRSDPRPPILDGVQTIEDSRGHKRVSQGFSQAEVEALKVRWACGGAPPYPSGTREFLADAATGGSGDDYCADAGEGEGEAAAPDSVECAICFRSRTEPLLLPCGHSFCCECVEPWLRRCALCPMCRQDLRALQAASSATSADPAVCLTAAPAVASVAAFAEGLQAASRGLASPAMAATRRPSSAGPQPGFRGAPMAPLGTSSSLKRAALRPASAPQRPPSRAPRCPSASPVRPAERRSSSPTPRRVAAPIGAVSPPPGKPPAPSRPLRCRGQPNCRGPLRQRPCSATTFSFASTGARPSSEARQRATPGTSTRTKRAR